MTKDEQRAQADKIANEWGCALQPGADGRLYVVVLDRYAQGSPQDDAKLSGCRKELATIGYDWVV